MLDNGEHKEHLATAHPDALHNPTLKTQTKYVGTASKIDQPVDLKVTLKSGSAPTITRVTYLVENAASATYRLEDSKTGKVHYTRPTPQVAVRKTVIVKLEDVPVSAAGADTVVISMKPADADRTVMISGVQIEACVEPVCAVKMLNGKSEKAHLQTDAPTALLHSGTKHTVKTPASNAEHVTFKIVSGKTPVVERVSFVGENVAEVIYRLYDGEKMVGETKEKANAVHVATVTHPVKFVTADKLVVELKRAATNVPTVTLSNVQIDACVTPVESKPAAPEKAPTSEPKPTTPVVTPVVTPVTTPVVKTPETTGTSAPTTPATQPEKTPKQPETKPEPEKTPKQPETKPEPEKTPKQPETKPEPEKTPKQPETKPEPENDPKKHGSCKHHTTISAKTEEHVKHVEASTHLTVSEPGSGKHVEVVNYDAKSSALLAGEKGWKCAHDDEKPTYTIELKKTMMVTGFEVKALHSAMEMYHSINGKNWEQYKEDGKTKVFEFHSSNEVEETFSTEVEAKYVKFVITKKSPEKACGFHIALKVCKHETTKRTCKSSPGTKSVTKSHPAPTGEKCHAFEFYKPLACYNIMTNLKDMPDTRIALSPKKGSVSELRPSGSGWQVTQADKPEITINLSEDNENPGLVDKLTISGNVKSLLVKYRVVKPSVHYEIVPAAEVDAEGYVSYNKGKPVECSANECEVVFMDPSTDKVGIMAYEIKVSLVEAVNPSESYNLKLDTYACTGIEYSKVVTKEDIAAIECWEDEE